MSTCNEDFLSTPFKIVCEDKEGRAAILPGAPPPFIAIIIFDNTPEPMESQVWAAQRVEGTSTFAFINTEHNLWACARGDHVAGSIEDDKQHCSWSVERDNNGKYRIHVPDKDLFWTVKAKVSGVPETLFLEPADGSEAQTFSFVPLKKD